MHVTILVTGRPLPETERVHGDFVRLIQQTCPKPDRYVWDACDVVRGDALPEPAAAGAVIVTGSAARLGDDEPWMRDSLTWLARVVHQDVPVLGICFGHQMLGQALGGRVAPNPHGREMGTVELTPLGPAPVFRDPNRHLVNMTHLDSVVELPPGARRLATSALEPNAAAYFGHRAYGVQYHPEITGSVMTDYVTARADQLRAEGMDPRQVLAAVSDTPDGASAVPVFLDWVETAGAAGD